MEARRIRNPSMVVYASLVVCSVSVGFILLLSLSSGDSRNAVGDQKAMGDAYMLLFEMLFGFAAFVSGIILYFGRWLTCSKCGQKISRKDNSCSSCGARF